MKIKSVLVTSNFNRLYNIYIFGTEKGIKYYGTQGRNLLGISWHACTEESEIESAPILTCSPQIAEFVSSAINSKEIESLEAEIRGLIERLHYEESCGRALDEFKERSIREVRKKYPHESSSYLDTEIADAYSAYCEDNYACGWTDVDIDSFACWAFKGAISLYINPMSTQK